MGGRKTSFKREMMEFNGQDYGTLELEAKKAQERTEINEELNIAFMSTQTRFTEPQRSEARLRSDVELKHQLIESINGFRNRPEAHKKPVGYSFGKAKRVADEFEISSNDN